MQAAASLSKLSSGARVTSAKDDAASLAIGSRLTAEIQGLKQATVNAGQASSMLQIADGAMAKVSDILTRMKTLATQSSSGQITNTERGMLDTEYQALLGEVDRISQVTQFNGTNLVAGSSSTTTTLNSQSAANDRIQASDGFQKIEFGNSVGDARFDVSYDSTSRVLTLKNLTTGVSQGIDIGAGVISQNGSQVVHFSQIDTTITLNSAFDKSASIAPTGAFTAAGAGTGSVQASTITLKNATDGMKTLTGSTVTVSGAAANAATLTLAGGFSATVDLTTTGTKSNVVLTNGTDSVTIDFTIDTAFNNAATAAGDATFTIGDLGTVAYANAATSNNTAFTFKIGTGTVAGVDDLTISFNSISTTALGVNGGSISTAAASNIAITAIASAIDTLNTARANIGSAQNRLEFASANLSTTVENQEAARSGLMDLDVASEMTAFTSKQVLLQAGVAMLSQANQMPNQLLKLLQQ
jgi:flagellin